MNKELKQLIKKDIFRYYSNKPPILYKWKTPTLKYVITLRRATYYKNKNKIIFIFYSLLLKKYSEKYLIQILPSTKIGKGLYIGHFGNIVINPHTIMGDNINIMSGVTIGQTNRGVKKGVPVIGNNVWIGANAVIVGDISVGDNVLIAPNSYVNNDVPKNSIVIGNPAKVISKKDATKGYINNSV